MTQISLSKAYAIIDKERGKVLAFRRTREKGTELYTHCSGLLALLNKLKKEFAIVSDSDQIPLGL